MTKIQKRRLRAAKRMHAKIVRFANRRDGIPQLRALATVAVGASDYPFNGDIVTATRTAVLYFVRQGVMHGKKLNVNSFPELRKVLKQARHLRKRRPSRCSLVVPLRYDDTFNDY